MSLINDALKRARVSALQQEAEAGGAQYRAVPAHSRRDPRSMVQLAGWVVAAVAIATVLVMALRPSTSGTVGDAARSDGEMTIPESPVEPAASERLVEPGREPPRESVAVPEAGGAATSLSVAVADPEHGGSSAPSGGGSASRVTMDPVAAESESSPSGPVAASGAVATDDGSGTPSPSPATPPAPPPQAPAPGESPPVVASPADRQQATARAPGQDGRPVDGAVYQRRATASDGSVVELGGIAYSEDHPIAVINGRVVSPGDMIRGFIVLAIEPERVRLEVDGVRIYLALR